MAVQKLDIYGCGATGDEKCDCLVQIVNACDECELVCTCCDQAMVKLEPKTADKATEKHVPVIEKIDGGYKVTVGTTLHPMVAEHWIQWIELRVGNQVLREYLSPGDEPSATFLVACEKCEPAALEHCNKHGLWQG